MEVRIWSDRRTGADFADFVAQELTFLGRDRAQDEVRNGRPSARPHVDHLRAGFLGELHEGRSDIADKDVRSVFDAGRIEQLPTRCKRLLTLFSVVALDHVAGHHDARKAADGRHGKMHGYQLDLRRFFVQRSRFNDFLSGTDRAVRAVHSE